MSIIEQAKIELKLINFGNDDSRVMLHILEMFFNQWNSGGAVWSVAPVLQRLIAGKPLSPLTGGDDEWFEHDHGIFQNKRASSVFKDKKVLNGQPYDLDGPGGHLIPITFPYWPDRAEVSSPIIEVEVPEK